MIGLLAGTHTILVGVEPDPGGGLRCYLGDRRKGTYCLVEDEASKAEVRRVWESATGIVEFPVPPEGFLFCDEEAAVEGDGD